MSYRKPVKFKNKPKWKKFTYHNGVKYEVMNIGGTEMEIRVANQSDVEAFKANKRSLYDK